MGPFCTSYHLTKSFTIYLVTLSYVTNNEFLKQTKFLFWTSNSSIYLHKTKTLKGTKWIDHHFNLFVVILMFCFSSEKKIREVIISNVSCFLTDSTIKTMKVSSTCWLPQLSVKALYLFSVYLEPQAVVTVIPVDCEYHRNHRSNSSSNYFLTPTISSQVISGSSTKEVI